MTATIPALTHPRTRSKTLLLAALTALALLCLSSQAHAQLGDQKIASAEYEYYPYAESNENALNPDGGEAAFQMFRTKLQLPTMLGGGSTILLPGFRYSLLDIIQRDRPNGAVDALHALLLSAGVLQRFDEHWAMFARIEGGIASNLAGDLTSDDWVVAGQLIGLWTIVPDFTLGAGVGYDRRTGSVSPLPLLALSWQPSEQFMIRGVVPESLAVRYRLVTWLTLGAEGSLEGERYHLSNDAIADQNAEVAHSIGKVGLAATVHCTRWLHTRLYGGAAVHRRFELYVDDDSQGDLEMDPAPYVGLEVAVGPSGWRADSRTP